MCGVLLITHVHPCTLRACTHTLTHTHTHTHTHVHTLHACPCLQCHKAKNFTPGKEAASSKASAFVLDIQRRLPLARVLYCSATGVSEVIAPLRLRWLGWYPLP